MGQDLVTIDAVTFREHISYLSVLVMNQSNVYVKLRTWLFLATFSFHYSINDLKIANLNVNTLTKHID